MPHEQDISNWRKVSTLLTRRGISRSSRFFSLRVRTKKRSLLVDTAMSSVATSSVAPVTHFAPRSKGLQDIPVDTLISIFSYLPATEMAKILSLNHYMHTQGQHIRGWTGSFLSEFSLKSVPAGFAYADFERLTQAHLNFKKYIEPVLLESDAVKTLWTRLTALEKLCVFTDSIVHVRASLFAQLNSAELVCLGKIAAACGAVAITNHVLALSGIPNDARVAIATCSVFSANKVLIDSSAASAGDAVNLTRALYFASVRGDVEIYNHLLVRFSAVPSPENINTAAAYGHRDLVRMLIARGVMPTQMTLEQAVISGNEATCVEILNAGCRLTISTVIRESAARHGHQELVGRLEQRILRAMLAAVPTSIFSRRLTMPTSPESKEEKDRENTMLNSDPIAFSLSSAPAPKCERK